MASILQGNDVLSYSNLQKQMDTELARLEVMVSRPQIIQNILKKMTPDIRRELHNSYVRSGLKRHTGDLYAALVTDSIIRFTGRTICVDLQGQLREQIYKQAASHQYGAVHGLTNSRSRKSMLNKQRLKGHASGDLGGGVWIQKATEPMTIRQDQADRLAERFVEIFEQEAKGKQ